MISLNRRSYKESGVEALKQAISHPVAAIIIAGVQGFMEAE
jgi:hypothetical protein